MKKIVLLTVMCLCASTIEFALGESLNGFFFGVGGGAKLVKNGLETKSTDMHSSNSKEKAFLRLLLGAGKSMNSHPVYVGTEFAVDVAKTYHGSFSSNLPNVSDIKYRHNGISPSFAFRVGCIDCAGSALLYVKAGLVYSKIALTYTNNQEQEKMTFAKLTPVIGIGVEVAFSDTYSTRFDAEYMTKATCENDSYRIIKKGSLILSAAVVHNLNF
jgi:hypothetical protein